jgi:hypothetical protein
MFLFLDFDGVLQPYPCRYQSDQLCHIPRLENVLRDFPEVLVVVSSSWKDDQDLVTLRSYFSADIAARIIDVTPHWSSLPDLAALVGPFQRQVEILGWLEDRGFLAEKWIAIDDRPGWFSPRLENLVLCNPAVGFEESAEDELRRKLGEYADPSAQSTLQK